jgi:thiamine transport system permease protein
MADRAQPVNPWPGFVAAALVAALILGTLGVVAWSAPGAARANGTLLTPSDWSAIRFTVSQALLSALISTVLAVPIARALARRRFPGRSLLITLLGAPFLLPVIVAVMGLLAVFGRSGWITQGLDILGLPSLSIYGFHGVILAHVFFNLPLATRIILQGWMEIPSERTRLAAHLGFTPRDMFRHIEVPLLIIFAICLSSFAVALTLGGGPRATTVELAIYQAFRFDFDLEKAASLALIQLLLAGSASLLALKFSQSGNLFGRGFDRKDAGWHPSSPSAKLLDTAAITCAALFLLIPLAAVMTRGAPAIVTLPVPVWSAAALSLQIAALSCAITLMLAISIALTAVRFKWIESLGLLTLAASPLVIGTGLFLVIFPVASPQDLALPVTASVNAVMALPFVLRLLIPSVQDACANYGRLALSLGLGPMNMLRLVILPRCRPALGFGAGLAAALSMGDLGVVALFASAEQATLPLQIFRLMGAYRVDAASGAAVLLALMSFGAFWICDTWGRRYA